VDKGEDLFFTLTEGGLAQAHAGGAGGAGGAEGDGLGQDTEVAEGTFILNDVEARHVEDFGGLRELDAGHGGFDDPTLAVGPLGGALKILADTLPAASTEGGEGSDALQDNGAIDTDAVAVAGVAKEEIGLGTGGGGGGRGRLFFGTGGDLPEAVER
jgi:hypothetical protein